MPGLEAVNVPDPSSLSADEIAVLLGYADAATLTAAIDAGAEQAVGTGDSPQFAGINLGHASDTTLTRASAGVVAVEGNNLITANVLTTNGDLLTRTAGVPARLGLGSALQVLRVNAAGTGLEYAATALRLVAKKSAQTLSTLTALTYDAASVNTLPLTYSAGVFTATADCFLDTVFCNFYNAAFSDVAYLAAYKNSSASNAESCAGSVIALQFAPSLTFSMRLAAGDTLTIMGFINASRALDVSVQAYAQLIMHGRLG